MGRKPKQTIDWYPRDADEVNDRSFRLLARWHGNDGIATLDILRCRLCKVTNGQLKVRDDQDAELLAEDCNLRDAAHFYQILEGLIKAGLVDRQLWESERTIYEYRVGETHQEVRQSRETAARKVARNREKVSQAIVTGNNPIVTGNNPPQQITEQEIRSQTQNRAGVCVDESVCGSPDQLPESPTQLEGSRLEGASHAGGDKFSAAMARAEALGVNVADKGLLNLAEMYPSHLEPAVEALAIAANVKNPTAWLKKAIEGGWKPEAQAAGAANTSPEIERFKAWRSRIEKETGQRITAQHDGNRMIVFIEALAFPFPEVEHFTADDYLAQVEELKSKAIA
jgi:predicted transcriptional regulator